MSKSRLTLEKKAATPPAVPRMTRSSASRARGSSPGPQQDPGPPGPQGKRPRKNTDSALDQNLAPGQHGKRPRKNTDSALDQDLGQMIVRVQDVSSPWPRGGLASASPRPRGGQASASPRPRGGLASASPRPRGGQASASPRPRGGLASVARLVKLGRCRNILVVVGAGISTASGIPDFRTPGTGLYANLERYNLPYPEAVFNMDYFSDHPQAFFSLAKELYPGRHRPNYIHYFIHTLHRKGLLQRVYTQNIDGLEKMCGIPDDKLVEAHGHFATASCHLCYTPYPAEDAKVAIMSGKVPTCSFCAGAVKPDVVFFGEHLPQKYFSIPKADLLIIMGTSLQIEPFASLVNTVRSSVPRLLLNRHAVGPFTRSPLRRTDHVELGDLVDSVQRFAQILGWSAEIQDLMKSQGACGGSTGPS
ncbi:hypothetical protein NHX12_002283, partial [Muraenolepis orangiensis]